MTLYISDDHGLGNFDFALVVLATLTIETYLERQKLAQHFCARRERMRPRLNEARWTLPPK